jgi:hypothetical protein
MKVATEIETEPFSFSLLLPIFGAFQFQSHDDLSKTEKYYGKKRNFRALGIQCEQKYVFVPGLCLVSLSI